ncbi:MAG: tRNA 2-thiouridine(34) synthase MnmA [Opitutae bacterium]|nr:tRNA 2-thiouridine(34) synthase MnmA [Opitutae bacterium]
MAKILVALSGGVDSAVAALLLKREGHDVSGAYMRTWMNEEGGKFLGECPWEDDVANARAVADKLGIPFRIVDLVKDYREHVVKYLVEGYRAGQTPNPDVLCNREMKFGVFARIAFADGFEFVATGHYARRRDNPDGTSDILCGSDPNKDQSYFLALLRQEQLRRALYPVGHLLKPQLRKIAADAGLPNAARKDSQGICFIGKIKINDFLEQYIPQKPGKIVRNDGRVLGEHKGLFHYTIGQRRGINVPSNTDGEHYVVVAKRFEENELVVAFDHPDTAAELYTKESFVTGLSWINRPILEEREILARVRYRDESTPIVFSPDDHGGAHIAYKRTQRGIASGQIIALYDNDVLLGGGVFR